MTYADIVDEIEDAISGQTSTDAPLEAAVALRAINAAYAEVWPISGGGIKYAGSPTAWASAQLATGTVFGLLTEIEDLLHVFVSGTAPSALTTVTAASATLTSAALFGSIKPGMHITGTGIPANTHVKSVESTASLTMTQVATDSTSNARTFSDTGQVSGTTEMDKAELSRIEWLRRSDLPGTYARPKLYSVTRMNPVAPAAAGVGEAGLLRLDYWPQVTGFYYPISYLPHFTPLDGGATDVPAVTPLEAYDIAWIAAADLAPRFGRAEFVPSILRKVSQGTTAAIEVKLRALLDAAQNT